MPNKSRSVGVLIAAAWVGGAVAMSPVHAASDAQQTQPAAHPPAQPPAQPESHPERGEQVDLRPRFLPGQVTKYEMLVNSHSQLTSKELPELDQKQAMKQTLRLSLRVVESGSDGATLELVYDAAKIAFENDDFSAEYDSANPTGAAPGGQKPAATTPAPSQPRGTKPGTNKPPASKPGSNKPAGSKPGSSTPAPAPATTPAPSDPLDAADPSKLLESLVKGMVGTKMTIKTDAAGNITSVTGDGGLSGMSKGFMSSVGGGVPGLSGAMPSGGDSAKWLINGPRASGTARVGESWTNDDSLGGTPLGEFKMKTTHTLVSHRGGRASLKFTGRAEAASAGTPSPTGFQLEQMTNDGTYLWDTERGSLEKMDADMRVGIEANITGAAMKHDTVTTVSVKRLDR